MRVIGLIGTLVCAVVCTAEIPNYEVTAQRSGPAAAPAGPAGTVEATPGSGHLADSFSTGWMLKDTNGDGIADAIDGRIVVPSNPSSAENAAAANCAARLAFGSAGLTLPLVMRSSDSMKEGPRFWIGKSAVPAAQAHEIETMTSKLDKGEGGAFAAGSDVALVGSDDEGLTEAANSFCARAPYLWEVPGEKFEAISEALAAAAQGTKATVVGVTYEKGKPGIWRAFIRASADVPAAALTQALANPKLATVHELIVVGGATPVSAVNPKPVPEAPPVKEDDKEPPKATPEEEEEEPEILELDLANLYTVKGLFKGSPKAPFPAGLKTHLYVPAGVDGVAIANFAARLGLEATGIGLPLASPAESAKPKKVKGPTILAGNSPLLADAQKKLQEAEAAAGQGTPAALPAGEGELRVVDDVFKKDGVVLVTGDDAGSVAALNLMSGRLPYLWETGKQHESLEDMRYDLHRFFALHSAVGQATDGVFLLDRWAKELAAGPGIKDVKAEVYVDVADPNLSDFVKQAIGKDLGVSNLEVTTGSLHAGTQCCDANPELHYATPSYPFHQAEPTFSEDVVIPWEGTRLIDAVKTAAGKIKSGQGATVLARVSEGPEQREKLTAQIEKMLTDAGANKSQTNVEVLCAYKQGYSWLVDEIAPTLQGKSPAAIQIEFAKNVDPTGTRAMSTPARWVQELYPVDEILAQKLNIPLEKITFEEFTPGPQDPTYRVKATDSAGKEILSRSFTVSAVLQPYNRVMPEYEQVLVDTGWVRVESGGEVLADQRITTDIEQFWDHYQNVTLPKVYQFILKQAKGEIRAEYQPLFDTLRMDIHLSEPDYNIGLDKERISSLEAIQEDTFYVTGNFIDMMGNLESGKGINYPGRILPIVHASEDGKDGHVRIDFYAKLAANPLVRLSWTDAQGNQHERERNLPALRGPYDPRLIAARVKDGADGLESLTWSFPVDFLHEDYDAWTKLELRDRVEHAVVSAERAAAQLHWLEEMHRDGLYADDLAYPHLKSLAVRLDLPRATEASVDKPSAGVYATLAVSAPAHSRPMISEYAGKLTTTPVVQWKEPISPEENAEILATLSKSSPLFNTYWLGRSYLGQNVWASDVMLPTTSALRSWAKESTLKASVIYSGRQHANEVSSTSHIDKLAEMLATDPKLQESLKQVNVVLHPIDNSDGAQLSVEMAKVTPDNLLHLGYHGSLSADVSDGRKEKDPIYPESRNRPLLIKAWLPDAFLNPHGYPSHEWVQPFSDYTGWVMARQADAGREWWLPRGWFTSLEYLRDAEHPYGQAVAYALRDRIVQAEANVPGLLPLETRMNARYARFGQRWDPRYMTQPIVSGIRFYMALSGTQPDSEEMSLNGVSPDITWDDGYTEAPDETAHGDYMKLVASAGLAFDMVHLNYLAQGKLRIVRTQKAGPDGVEWKISRKRPILPSSEPAAPSPDQSGAGK